MRGPGMMPALITLRATVDEIRVTEIAHAGETGKQGAQRALGCVVRGLGGKAPRVDEIIFEIVAARFLAEMGMHVDETRKQGRIPEVDHAQHPRSGEILADGSDALAFDGARRPLQRGAFAIAKGVRLSKNAAARWRARLQRVRRACLAR